MRGKALHISRGGSGRAKENSTIKEEESCEGIYSGVLVSFVF